MSRSGEAVKPFQIWPYGRLAAAIVREKIRKARSTTERPCARWDISPRRIVPTRIEHWLTNGKCELGGRDFANSAELSSFAGVHTGAAALICAGTSFLPKSPALPSPPVRPSLWRYCLRVGVARTDLWSCAFWGDFITGPNGASCSICTATAAEHIDSQDQTRLLGFRDFRKRTPSPPPLSWMKSIPAASRARRMAVSFGTVTGISPSTTSALRMVATPTFEAAARSRAVQRSSARAARI
jgi:hypothetical protein